MNNSINNGRALEWDAEIVEDGQDNPLLPEGEYNFFVEKVERKDFPGSAKIPACSKITLTLRVNTDDGKVAHVWTDLILYSTLEWKLSSFFRSIGQKQHGERVKMDWNKVEGSVGRAHFKPRTYTNKAGEERTVNAVDKYIDWDPQFAETDVDFTKIPATEDDGDMPF